MVCLPPTPGLNFLDTAAEEHAHNSMITRLQPNVNRYSELYGPKVQLIRFSRCFHSRSRNRYF